MEYIIENTTKEERKILDVEGFEWYPDDMENTDIVIEGDEQNVDKALRAIGRYKEDFVMTLINALETIYNYCMQHAVCEMCPLRDEGGEKCSTPIDWDISKIAEKIEEDLAK